MVVNSTAPEPGPGPVRFDDARCNCLDVAVGPTGLYSHFATTPHYEATSVHKI